MNRNAALASLVAAMGTVACGPADTMPITPFSDTSGLDGGPDPDGGPGTAAFRAQVALGQLLFFDKELSGNRNISCGTCHVPFLSTTEMLPLSLGEGAVGVARTRSIGRGAILARHTQDLFNRAEPEVTQLFWDGRVSQAVGGSLEGPVPAPAGLSGPLGPLAFASIIPLIARQEMLGQAGSNDLASLPDDSPEQIWAGIVQRLVAIPEYRIRFSQSFEGLSGTQPTIAEVGIALAEFQRFFWRHMDSRFDLEGLFPLSFTEEAGRRLFFGDAGCSRCHSGTLLSDMAFHNIAIPQFGPGIGADGLDEGRAEVTGRAADRFRFRTPPLRNVAVTPPYMHNGAYDSLDDVIRHHLDPEGSLRGYSGMSLPESLRRTLKDDPDTILAILSTLDAQAVMPVREILEPDIFDLVAFLQTLTVGSELEKPPTAGVPAAVPSGLPIDEWPTGPHPFR